MLEVLFSSRVRVKILTRMILNPGKIFNVRELALQIEENYNPVWKELDKLAKVGILLNDKRSGQNAFSLNPSCSYLPELRSLILKTDGVGSYFLERISEIGKIKTAFIFGSFAAGEADSQSDIDLMIIGDVKIEVLSSVISSIEQNLNREINYIIYTEEEWARKKNEKSAFIQNILHAPKILLIGAEDAI